MLQGKPNRGVNTFGKLHLIAKVGLASQATGLLIARQCITILGLKCFTNCSRSSFTSRSPAIARRIDSTSLSSFAHDAYQKWLVGGNGKTLFDEDETQFHIF
jgi:hypothetical protein